MLTEEQTSFVGEQRFGVLATINRDGTAQQSTMWYELDGKNILMNTKAGRRKERNLQRDRRVSLCMEDGYRYITIRGLVDLIYDPVASQRDIRRLAIRYHGEEAGDRQSREQFSKEERVTILLHIEKVIAEGF